MTVQAIKVRHNVEMAHRLFLTPGKCEAIHGHSWNVTLQLIGEVDNHGLLASLDFGSIKMLFRKFLDSNFDHRVLLNVNDPWANLRLHTNCTEELPGLALFEGDPTTENLAKTIGEWGRLTFPSMRGIGIEVWETRVNNATWSWNATS